MSTKKLKHKLDTIFSRYIRLRDKCVCCTCGETKPMAKMQAGHYITRGRLATRFDEQNVHCQCVACNIFRKGNYPAYSLFMIRTYGEGILEEMDQRKNKIFKVGKAWYEEKIAEYLALVAELEQDLI